MKAGLTHLPRLAGRLPWLAGELALATLRYAGQCAFRSADTGPTARAAWMQHTARRLLRVFAVEIRVSGTPPESGLLVSNHLGYLDVIALGSLNPSVFVARHDVQAWPVFGWLASRAGTIYIQRARRVHVGPVTAQIQAVLDTGGLVILFPEGTSSDGRTVLPFKSSLLEPATRPSLPLAAGWIQYELDDGDVGEEVCYWKNMTFLPHLLNLLSKRRVRATIRFTAVKDRPADRKELARQLHAEVLQLKAGDTTELPRSKAFAETDGRQFSSSNEKRPPGRK